MCCPARAGARSSASGSGFPSGTGAGRPSPPGSFASPAPRHLRRRPRPARVPRAPGTPPAFPVTPRPVSVAAALFHFPLFRHASAAVRFVCARAGNPARRFLPRPARPPAFSIPSRRLSRRRPPFPSRPARFPFLRRPPVSPRHRCPFHFPPFPSRLCARPSLPLSRGEAGPHGAGKRLRQGGTAPQIGGAARRRKKRGKKERKTLHCCVQSCKLIIQIGSLRERQSLNI